MADSFGLLVKEHHAFYEVSPDYVELEERPVGLPAKTRRVQAGFNVDVYGIRTEDNEPAMPPPSRVRVGLCRITEDCGKGFAAFQRLLLTRGYSVPFCRHHRYPTSGQGGSNYPHQNFTWAGSRSTGWPPGTTRA